MPSLSENIESNLVFTAIVALENSFKEDLGVDSLDLFQVVIEIEEKYGIQLENAENIKSVKDAVSFVEAAVK